MALCGCAFTLVVPSQCIRMSEDESIERAERWVRQHGLQSPLDLKYAFKDSAEASAAGGPDVAKLWETTSTLPLKVDPGWEFPGVSSC